MLINQMLRRDDGDFEIKCLGSTCKTGHGPDTDSDHRREDRCWLDQFRNMYHIFFHVIFTYTCKVTFVSYFS